jgi:geranylgeranyl pyrophosphate synthase
MNTFDGFIAHVKNIVSRHLHRGACAHLRICSPDEVLSGKMLRTRLAARLCTAFSADRESEIAHACAAIELIHTASLFHDDVVDNALMRRGKPTLWQTLGPNAAILTGDILLCEALLTLVESGNAALLQPFSELVREVTVSETEQELKLRGNACDAETCIRVARGKTGPLFAFVGFACAEGDMRLGTVLREVGYRLGTAYQLADDLLDEQGDELTVGKTLGSDRLRKKFTLAQTDHDPRPSINCKISDLCGSSLNLLREWPDHYQGLKTYIELDLRVLTQSPRPPNSYAALAVEGCRQA